MPIEYEDLGHCLQNLVLAVRNAASAISQDVYSAPHWMSILEEFASTIEDYLEERNVRAAGG